MKKFLLIMIFLLFDLSLIPSEIQTFGNFLLKRDDDPANIMLREVIFGADDFKITIITALILETLEEPSQYGKLFQLIHSDKSKNLLYWCTLREVINKMAQMNIGDESKQGMLLGIKSIILNKLKENIIFEQYTIDQIDKLLEKNNCIGEISIVPRDIKESKEGKESEFSPSGQSIQQPQSQEFERLNLEESAAVSSEGCIVS